MAARKPLTIDHFHSGYIPEPNTGCWLWERALMSGGYGAFRWRKGLRSAHRSSWVIHNGPIPKGLWVLHKCDQRSCVNPDHLYLGTVRDNVDDMLRRGRKRWTAGPRLPGEDNPRAKLTWDRVRAIRASHDTTASLARKFGVSESAVKFAREGKTWRETSVA